MKTDLYKERKFLGALGCALLAGVSMGSYTESWLGFITGFYMAVFIAAAALLLVDYSYGDKERLRWIENELKRRRDEDI